MPDRGVLADRTRRIGRCLTEHRGDGAMNEPTIETLARRVDRVERENRLLKWAGVLALTRAVLVGLVSLAEAQDVEQHKRRSMTGIPDVYVLVESLTSEIEQGGLHTSRRQRVTGLLVEWEQLSRFHLPCYLL